MDKLFDMIEFATLKHRGQFRKDGKTPFVYHPMGVLKRLIDWGIDPNEEIDLACAAVGHDLLEDTETSYEEINNLFGVHVVNFINELTFISPYPKGCITRKTNKQTWIDSFATAPVEVFVLKSADRICNLFDIGYDYKWMCKYFKEAQSLWGTDRNHEIVERFGGDVAESIESDWHDFHRYGL